MAFDSFQLLTPAICSTNKDLFMITFLIGLFGPNWPDSDEIDAKGCSGVNKNTCTVVAVNGTTRQ